MEKPKDIDEYISRFPPATRKLLTQVRKTVAKAVPGAAEIISYGMPAFALNGTLLYFAGYKNHIGFYPTASGIRHFARQIQDYEHSKGAIRLPLDQPLPTRLIAEIARFRATENSRKALAKGRLRTCPNGHQYYKSSDCPTCPICEKERRPKDGFLSLLSAPARRALENKHINTLKQLAGFTEREILALHGMGPSSIPKLKAALEEAGLSFKA